MHLTRAETTTRLPIPRKGTRYIARASSHVSNSVSVVLAVRDMLKLAKTAKEVKEMIKEKLLKINGRLVKEYRESIQIFDVFEADKSYVLTLLPTNKFAFEDSKEKDIRLCKVINKRLISKGLFQLNLHDGSNVLTKDKISVGDSVYLDFAGKIKKHVSLEKGKEVFIISGKYTGLKGKVEAEDHKKITVKFKEASAVLDNSSMIAL